MAVIRIKRTTGFGTPTGLTFGELAFVQGDGSGGRTANRLYIADNRGVSVWIGAEILNSPTFWNGATAETTVPTVGAVEGRMVAGGAITFASDLAVNIADGKYFGKYQKNDIIPATGQTVKWVIEDALSEKVAPVVTLSSPSAVGYGQTSGTITLNFTYTIKTAGACAAGSTLEFRYNGQPSWSVLPGGSNLFNNAFGLDQQYSGSLSHTNWDRRTDLGAGGTYGGIAFTYRWTVHDTQGSSASVQASITPNTTANLSVSSFGTTAANLRNGVLGAPSGTETDVYREKGNTYSTVRFTINPRSGGYVPLRNYVLQAREYVNNSWSSWSDFKSEAVSGTSSITRGITYTPVNTGASLDRLEFRVLVNDEANNSTTPGTTFTSSTSAVFFDYMMFFGGTANTSINSTMIRGLSSGIVAGNGNGSGGGASGGLGAMALTIGGTVTGTGVMPSSNAVALTGPNSNTRFIVAVPDNVTISQVLDVFLSNIDITTSFTNNLSTTITTINDRSGSPKNYNVYIASTTGYEDGVHDHRITRTGTVAQP